MGLNYDDYEILDTIGVGTVGTIQRVRQKATDKFFALKLLSPAVSNDDLIVARFHREIMVLSKLKHPNIVAYYGEGQHDGQIFYLMEYIRGGTVKDLLSTSGGLGWLEVAECGRQLASALQHAHNHGIIHRDIKPGNIFLTLDGVSKLGDFGIARDMKSPEITDAGLTVGTYAYMAPELIRGERSITGEVDLYALGCLLFEMLVGRTPFLGDNFAQLFEQHLRVEPPRVRDFRADCPMEFDELINSLLKKAPEERPFNARAVQGILGELSSASDETPSTGKDRAASAVRPGQVLLRRRILGATTTASVGFTKILVLLVILGVLIGGTFLLIR